MKKILLVIFTLVSLSAFAQNNGDIVDRLNATLGVRLPAEYEAKVKEFVNTNKIMKNKGVADFTSQFIAKEMENDWKIDKQSQLLFLWQCIYSELTETNLYRGEGGNIKIKEDFNAPGVSTRIRANKYKYQKNLNRMSAEADRRSAEADRMIMHNDTLGLKEMKDFYSLYIHNPNNVKKEEIERSKELLKWVIPDCLKYRIDYKAILRKELGDDKKVQEVLKFYGVE